MTEDLTDESPPNPPEFTEGQLSSSDSDDEVPSSTPAEVKLAKALGLKDAGNDALKKGDLDKAVRSYRRGVASIKSLNEGNTGDEQVKALLVALRNNMSMALGKQEKWQQCHDVAVQVLEVDTKNLKALFRAGMAQRKMGDLQGAKKTLRRGLEVDAGSTDVKRELALVIKALQVEKEKAKKAFGGAFDSGTGGLYDDKEEERKLKAIRKKEEEEKKRVEEEKKMKERKKTWEDECVARMARSEPPVSFEDWCKEEDAKVEEEKKKKKKEEEEEKKRRRREQKERKKHEVVRDDSDDEDLGLKKEQVRGYKTTSDGRKTSYFNNEMDEQTKNLIGDIAPKPIGSASSTPQPVQRTSSGTAASAWNSAGTFEEKDTTKWCKSAISQALASLSSESGSFAAKVTKVGDVSGDASVIMSRGKKRYLFDHSVTLDFTVEDDVGDEAGKGKITLGDISSTAAGEGEYEMEVTFKKGGGATKVRDAVDGLKAVVKTALDGFVARFNTEY